LFASLPGLGVEERGDAQGALAWLGDGRDLDATRRLAHERLHAPAYQGRQLKDHGWGSVYALCVLGTSDDRRALVYSLVNVAREAVVDDPDRPRIKLTQDMEMISNRVIGLLVTAGFRDEATAARAELTAVIDALRSTVAPQPTRPTVWPVEREPVLERTVPRLTFAELVSDPPDEHEWPPAKFGGQPDWVAQPAWPLGPGRWPMIFYGQFPLLGAPSRVAYLFFSAETVDTFEPLADANAVVVQPGAAPQVDTLAMRNGPQLFESVRDTRPRPPLYGNRPNRQRPYERFVVLTPGTDPPEWTWPKVPEGAYIATSHGDWNKIGGTPLFLQGNDWPHGHGWEFAFQFTASWAGHEFGDGAECYGFANTDGRGAFLWQCH
jgi:hypothetical protein